MRLEPRWVVDIVIRCTLRDRLSERFPGARIVSCGLSPGVLSPSCPEPARLPEIFLSSPMRLPLVTGFADLVASNLALCWYADVLPVLEEMWRVLRPGGLATFTTLGPGTLEELRRSWKAVDSFSHVLDFMDMHDVGDAMVRAGFTDVVMDAEVITVTWPDMPGLLGDLRGLGTGNPHPNRRPGLLTPRGLAALIAAYRLHECSSGRVPASVELVHGHGWKPAGRTAVSFEMPIRRR